jgi:hypothetical protein
MEGLPPSAELPIEEQEEHELERSRVLMICGVAGLASSLSRPKEAMSSMKEGRAAIDTKIADVVRCQENSLQ